MKNLFAITTVAALVVLANPAFAQHHGHDAHQAAPSAQGATAEAVTMTEGMVRRVNADQGTVSIAHGPIAHLNMPPMTMTFNAADGVDLSAIKPGDKVRFEPANDGGRLTIHQIEVVR